MKDIKKSCGTCIHCPVCHLLFVVRKNNEIINNPPEITHFLGYTGNLAYDCVYWENTKKGIQ